MTLFWIGPTSINWFDNFKLFIKPVVNSTLKLSFFVITGECEVLDTSTTKFTEAWLFSISIAALIALLVSTSFNNWISVPSLHSNFAFKLWKSGHEKLLGFFASSRSNSQFALLLLSRRTSNKCALRIPFELSVLYLAPISISTGVILPLLLGIRLFIDSTP